MLKDIVAARALGDYRWHLRFEDGVDLAPHLSFQEVFGPLRKPAHRDLHQPLLQARETCCRTDAPKS
jgi:hypothetical protein